MATSKKSLQQQIDEQEARLKKLKAMKASLGLEDTAPGMTELILALDEVVKLNKCTVADVLRSVSRIKRQGLTITAATRTKRTPGVQVDPVEPTSTSKPAAPRKTK